MRTDEYPERGSPSKLGLLLILLIGLFILYFAGGFIFNDEEEEQCNPDFDENCEHEINIIVRFIGNYKLLLTNTNPF